RRRRLILVVRHRGEVGGQLLVNVPRLDVYLLRLPRPVQVQEQDPQVVEHDGQHPPVHGYRGAIRDEPVGDRYGPAEGRFRLRWPFQGAERYTLADEGSGQRVTVSRLGRGVGDQRLQDGDGLRVILQGVARPTLAVQQDTQVELTHREVVARHRRR